MPHPPLEDHINNPNSTSMVRGFFSMNINQTGLIYLKGKDLPGWKETDVILSKEKGHPKMKSRNGILWSREKRNLSNSLQSPRRFMTYQRIAWSFIQRHVVSSGWEPYICWPRQFKRLLGRGTYGRVSEKVQPALRYITRDSVWLFKKANSRWEQDMNWMG